MRADRLASLGISVPEIMNAINSFLKAEDYYLNSNASLSGLAKKIGYSSHSVSQVINEKEQKNCFQVIHNE